MTEAAPPSSRRPLRVLIVDDERLYAEALMTPLSLDARVEVVGTAESGREAVERTRELQPDIVLMDVGLPGLDGIDATREIAGTGLPTRVIILTNHGSDENMLRAREAGAAGFVTKDRSISELLDTIDAIGALATSFHDGQPAEDGDGRSG